MDSLYINFYPVGEEAAGNMVDFFLVGSKNLLLHNGWFCDYVAKYGPNVVYYNCEADYNKAHCFGHWYDGPGTYTRDKGVKASFFVRNDQQEVIRIVAYLRTGEVKLEFTPPEKTPGL